MKQICCGPVFCTSRCTREAIYRDHFSALLQLHMLLKLASLKHCITLTPVPLVDCQHAADNQIICWVLIDPS